MKLPNLTQVIEIVVIFIAAGSFIISYNNLHESAIEMGIPWPMSFIFPLTIDAFLIICTLFVLYAGQKCKPTWEGWLFLVLYTIASISFNIHMAPDDWWSRAGFAMCPIGLCIALHFLMRILEIEMGGCPVPVVAPQVIEESPIEGIEEEPPVMVVQVEDNRAHIPITENQRKVLEAYKEEPGVSKAEACRRTGLSYKTVSAHYTALKEMGMI